MSVAFARLKSMLPQRSETAENAFVSAPAALRGWMDDVPLANRGFAMQRLHDMLCELNATPYTVRQRLSMLGMFEAATAALVDDARNEVREFFPMSAERIEDAQLRSEVEHQLAIGYVVAVCDLCAPSGKVPFLHGGQVAEALTHACLHQGLRFWLACRTHRKPAEGMWQSLHDLFRYAIECGCADKAKVPLANAPEASVRSVYAQVLLHAFARPNQFTQHQNRQLHTSLPVLASWCDVRAGHAPPGTIAVYAAGDSSPPTPPRGAQVDAGDRWLLDVAPLLAEFDSLLAARDEGEVEIRLRARRHNAWATLSVDTIEVLKRVWSERIEREFPRSPDDGEYETEVGLAGLHLLLLAGQDFESALPQVGEGMKSVASWATRAPGRTPTKRARARAVDRCRRGYRLQWEVGEDARARVGELIALAPVGRQGQRQWNYGALRWLRADPKAGIDAGIELLPSPPVAVAVYALDATGTAHSPVRGILVDMRAAGAKRDGGAGILVPRPFASDAVALDVIRFPVEADEAASRPVRVAKFAVREAGLYQKILLPDDALMRIVHPETDADAGSG